MTLYPELTPVRYPKAGTDNSEVRLGVVELASGETTWIDVEPGDGGDFYIARMDFANSAADDLVPAAEPPPEPYAAPAGRRADR